MSIPTITPLPQAPQVTDAPSVFSQRANTFVAALGQLVTETNATTAEINQALAGALVLFDAYEGDWEAGSYAEGDVVRKDGVFYISLTDSNTQEPPDSNWQELLTAAQTSFDPSASGLSALNVQAAIDEVQGGLGTMAEQDANNVTITGGSIAGVSMPASVITSGTIPVNRGGTNATTAAAARANLGLGSMAQQNANNVSITGGSISGVSGLLTATGGFQTVTGNNFTFTRSGIGSAVLNTSVRPLELTQTGTFDALGIFSNQSFPRGIDVNFNQDAGVNGRFFQGRSPQNIQRIALPANGGISNFSANNVNLSDERYKKDIAPLPSEWDCVKQWEIVSFRYIDQPFDEAPSYGVIAQQVEPFCPELVKVYQEAKDAVLDEQGNEIEPAMEERLGVREPQMMWLAVKTLQEAMNRIETLEAEVASLKAAQ